VDAVFYPVALNAIPMKKKQKASEEKSSRNQAEGSERMAQGLEGNRQLSRSAGCGLATMGEIRHARVTREGRVMYASPEGLSRYHGREAGLDLPVHIATANMELSSDLRRALSYERSGSKVRKRR
jgi:hypothetical protein